MIILILVSDVEFLIDFCRLAKKEISVSIYPLDGGLIFCENKIEKNFNL